MNIAIEESDYIELSPEAEAAASGLMSLYGKTLLVVHLGMYTGIIISGAILQFSKSIVDTSGSILVWWAYFAVALLIGRELAPIGWYWVKTLRKPKESSVVLGLAAYMGAAHAPTPTPIKKRDRSGWVYLVQSPTGYYKIGRTSDPDNRVKTFKVKLPFEVEYICLIQTGDMYILESQLHIRFADKRVNGEWFNLESADVEYIRSLT